jgi:aryl-alcohol dehydrogenase-like predicted oxidoreductase
MRQREAGACATLGIAVAPGGDAIGLAKRFKPEVMQVFAGLLDQRLIRMGALSEIASGGVEVQIRTALLHGLLFLPREGLPPALAEAGPQVSRVRRMIAEAGADPLQAALAFALDRPEASAVILEAGSVGEVRAILAAACAPSPQLDWPSLALDHPAALDAEAHLSRCAA